MQGKFAFVIRLLASLHSMPFHARGVVGVQKLRQLNAHKDTDNVYRSDETSTHTQCEK
jgi:hypothetical protein